jgi:hypothetical protein
LEDKACKLQTPYKTIRISVAHIFVADNDIVFGSHVVSQVVVNDEP